MLKLLLHFHCKILFFYRLSKRIETSLIFRNTTNFFVVFYPIVFDKIIKVSNRVAVCLCCGRLYLFQYAYYSISCKNWFHLKQEWIWTKSEKIIQKLYVTLTKKVTLIVKLYFAAVQAVLPLVFLPVFACVLFIKA